MPSLEEYAFLWHAVKHEQNRMIDTKTRTWLRTRFGPSLSSALNADEYDGPVLVCGWGADGLGISYSIWGSRASDPVER
jgi:hypothetical protein